MSERLPTRAASAYIARTAYITLYIIGIYDMRIIYFIGIYYYIVHIRRCGAVADV